MHSHNVTCKTLGLLPAATKLGQSNVFTGVCDSVHRRGVCLSACWDTTPPGADIPHTPGADPPGADTPPGSRHLPWSSHPPGVDPHSPQSRHPPGSRHPLGLSTPPRTKYTPVGLSTAPGTKYTPGKQTPAYGQRAAGTHPTGMHSCFISVLKLGNYFSFVSYLCIHILPVDT